MDRFEGRISASSFSTGERIVIGDWSKSPLGKFVNIMWARPNGRRILISPSEKCAEYVSKIYSFEEVIIQPIEIKRNTNKIEIKALDLKLIFEWKSFFPLPINRPRWFISTIENFIGNLVFGSKTFGKTRDGRKEWYMIKGISFISKAHGENRGESFGTIEYHKIPALFGFSEPPKRPSSVKVVSLIEKTRLDV